jgi:hypothetical protein
MFNDREPLAPFWYSSKRLLRSHVYRGRQWILDGGGYHLCYLSLCNRVDWFTPGDTPNTGKTRCATCDNFLLAWYEAGGLSESLPVAAEGLALAKPGAAGGVSVPGDSAGARHRVASIRSARGR